MIDLADITRELTAHAAAMTALVQTISDAQARWKPGPDIWSMHEVMDHVYNEERLDFRQHLQELYSEPPLPWDGARTDGWIKTASCQQALDAFLAERQQSLAWLASSAAGWDLTAAFHTRFGTLSGGDLLISWVEHDVLHLRQMIELLHAWHEQQAAPYSIRYAGEW